MLNGIDFSFGSGLTTAQIKAGGKAFVCRYLSGGGSKDISAAELKNYKDADIPVVFVWETDGIMRSETDGIAAARAAEAELARIGASGAVVFFAADAATMPDLHGYMTGVVSVLGKARTGIYGGIGSVASAFNAGLATFGWQTIAWSAGQWDDRALLRQVQNAVTLGPAQVDLDEAAFWASATRVLTLSDDFGQWPRPSAPPTPTGPVRHVVPNGNTLSLYGEAQQRGTTSAHLIEVSKANLDAKNLAVFNGYLAFNDICATAGINHATMPTGMVWYSES